MAVALSPLARLVLQHPEWLEQEAAERSLHEFVQLMWPHVETEDFQDNWHIRIMCEHLEAVTRGEIKRLLINIPPRHSKSSIVAVMWPGWTWLKRKRFHGPLAGPQVKFMSASYAQALSTRDSRAMRRLIESDLYQEFWGDRFRLTSDQNAKMRFENNKGGYRLATSVGGSLTGEGGDIIIVDDAHNVNEASSDLVRQSTIEWWDESMSTRLNNPATGAYVLIMQRVHHQDLAGHVIDKQGDNWTHLCLPARYEPEHPHVWEHDPREIDGELLWPERFTDSSLKALEESLGSYAAAGQLQQRPSPREGGMFDPTWWKYVDAVPAGGRVGRGWDLAASEETTSSWTAGVRMRLVDGTYYIEDMVRIRGTSETVEKTIEDTAEKDGKIVLIDIPQDPGQAGKAQVRWMVRRLAGYNVRYSPETGSKETRAQAMSAQAEAGNVKLVRGPWNHTFIEEAQNFPNSDYKDQIDACSRIFHRLTRQGRSRGFAAPPLLPTVG